MKTATGAVLIGVLVAGLLILAAPPMAHSGLEQAVVMKMIPQYDLGDENGKFRLTVEIDNRGEEIDVDVYIVLYAFDMYLFWPAWTRDLDYETWTLPAQSISSRYVWTFWCQPDAPVLLISCICKTGTFEILDKDLLAPCGLIEPPY